MVNIAGIERKPPLQHSRVEKRNSRDFRPKKKEAGKEEKKRSKKIKGEMVWCGNVSTFTYAEIRRARIVEKFRDFEKG